MIELSNFTSFFVANWKLNGSYEFIDTYLEALNKEKFIKNCVVLSPPYLYLDYIKNRLNNFYLCSQNCSSFQEGAYTGEISAKMLRELGVHFCIIGHSERRQYFKETSIIVKEKAARLIENAIVPIICIGETLEEKEKSLTNQALKYQLEESLPENSNNFNTIIAYEPVWAIGTGLTPSLEEIANTHKFIRNINKKCLNLKILYGGSVNVKNSRQICQIKDVNGALIGGSSLKINDFVKIIYDNS